MILCDNLPEETTESDSRTMDPCIIYYVKKVLKKSHQTKKKESHYLIFNNLFWSFIEQGLILSFRHVCNLFMRWLLVFDSVTRINKNLSRNTDKNILMNFIEELINFFCLKRMERTNKQAKARVSHWDIQARASHETTKRHSTYMDDTKTNEKPASIRSNSLNIRIS